MLLVSLIIDGFARLGMELLPCVFADGPVELDIRGIQFGLARLQYGVEPLNQAGHFLLIKDAVVIVQIIQVGVNLVLRLVIAALDSPDVRPMGRRRVVCAKQIVRGRNPLVEVFLDEPAWNPRRLDHAAQAVVAGAHVEGFFAQHVGHGAPQGREARILQHLQLELAVAVDEVGVSEEVHPVVDVDVECAEQALVLKGTPLQHLLCFNFARISEVIDQERTHLPAMAHLLDHDPRNRTPVPVGWRGLEQVPLLLDARKFRVALVHDQVHERVAHLLGGHLAEVFPLLSTFE